MFKMDLASVGIVLVISILSSINPVSSTSPAPLILTHYINESKLGEARNLSVVNPSLFLNLTSHSGYLTVNPVTDSNIFFWYFPVQGADVETTPWIIWLQGGPGVSSLAGLFDEIGPFEYTNHELKPRQYAWTRNFSVLFIDNPVGAGYSFTDKNEGYVSNSNQYSSHLYSALQQFLTIFPELRKAPLFIAGESYAGRYVPGLAQKIMEAGQLTDQWTISLEGLILGNPVLNREDIVNLTDAYYQWGLIDSLEALALRPLQEFYRNAVKKGDFLAAKKYREDLYNKLDDITKHQQDYNILVDDYMLKEFEEYLKVQEVREALHVGDREYNFRSDAASNKLAPDFLNDVNPVMEKLLNKYKVLIYCGQLDLIAPCVPNAEARRNKWHWSKRDEFMNEERVAWWYERTVAGYIKKGGGLEEALILGAGHLAPIDKPAEVYQLVSSFIQNIETEIAPDYNNNKEPSPSVTTKVTDTTNPPTTTTINSEPATQSQAIPSAKPDQSITTVKSDKVISVTPESNITPKDSSTAASAGTIVSIVLNVVLVLIVVIGAFLYYRLKKRSQENMYNNVENNSDDIFLT